MDISANRSWVDLSSRQLSIWLELQTSGHASSYQIGGYTCIAGKLDPLRFREAVALVAQQHEALRIEIDSLLPRQRVLDTIIDPVDVLDFSAQADPEGAFLDLAERTFVAPLELNQGPLFRITLVRVADERWYCLLRCHHLIIDGLSVPLLISLLSQAYTQLGSGIESGARASTYLDFVSEDSVYRASPRARRDLDFWLTELADLPDPVFIPSRPAVDITRASSLLLRWELSREMYDRFVSVCDAVGLRPMQALVALVGSLVRQLTNGDDAIIGVAVPGRGRGARHKVGMFNGAMPVRLRMEDGFSFVELATHAGAQLASAYPAQRASIDAICRELEVSRTGRRGIFEVFMSYIPAEVSAFAYELDGIELDPVILRGPEANPLAIYISERSAKQPVLVEFAFNPDYLTGEDTALLLERFQTLFAQFNRDPHSDCTGVDLFTPEEREQIRGERLPAPNAERRIRLVSSFTAEPLEAPLRFWFKQLKIHARIEFADYNSLFQELLNPDSRTRSNTDGANLLLVRIEDWLRYRNDGDGDVSRMDADFVRSTTQDFLQAVVVATASTKVPYIVSLCAPSADWDDGGKNAALQELSEAIMKAALLTQPGVQFVSYHQIRQSYPCVVERDADGDRLGHVPFTVSGFAAIATALARRLHLALRRKSKVIVVDCDNTLWAGVVGEDGVDALRLDAIHLALQRRLVAAASAGLLVCLCSKNIEDDVLEVFDRRSDMILRREHIVSHRINWDPKSQNIRDLAEELDLGLDSFVFLDDNPVEIAEVATACPEVLTIQFDAWTPTELFDADHLWPLDVGAATAEDSNRTRFYKENAQRVQLRGASGDFASFIESLNLEIRIAEPTDAELSRLEQLTERTNQFNINGVRRSAGEFAAARGGASQNVRAIFVKDRFGDYGLVGALLARACDGVLDVETLLMSCRVLGRGVEHAMIAELGRIALQLGCTTIRLETRVSARNQPVRVFVGKLPGSHVNEAECVVTTLKAAEACIYKFLAESSTNVALEADRAAPARSLPSLVDLDGLFWREIATRLNTVALIEAAVRDANLVLRDIETSYRAPRTSLEQRFAEKLAELLAVDRVGIDDNLFEIGLQSLKAVQFVAHIRSTYNVKLSIRNLFENPTVAGISHVLDEHDGASSYSALVPLQAGNGVEPLFCLHPANGDAVSYMRLAKALGPEQTVYAFEACGLAENEAPASSVEEMAEAYISEMKAVMPHGPYNLLGWSFGGVIAYEMACRLRERGDKVGYIFFLDTATPYGRGEPDLTFDEVLRIFARDLHTVEKSLDVRLGSTMNGENPVSIQEVIQIAQRIGAVPPEYSEAEARRKIIVHTNCISLFRKWDPAKSDLDITLFRATKHPERMPFEWKRYTTGKITIVKIPCIHVRIGFEPFVNQVADYVVGRLRNEPLKQPWWLKPLGRIANIWRSVVSRTIA